MGDVAQPGMSGATMGPAGRPAVVPRRTTGRAVKRGLDIACSLLLIVLLLPIALVLCVAIWMDSRGSILFVQRRLGRGGVEFRLLKFRTMFVDAEDSLADQIADDERFHEWNRSRKLRDDPRVSRVGRVLRRYSLDELPQLLNVLRGNMSLVGPRPVVPEEIGYFGDRGKLVLSVRPGLTGLWAVSGRSDTSYQQRVELEARYAAGWNLRTDLGILLKTLPVVVRGHGAY
jgi:exopolysaccharide production protein ExoY